MSSTQNSAQAGRSLGLKLLILHPGTYFQTLFRGRFIGRDGGGNQYFERAGRRGKARTVRWVIYAGKDDPSSVPAEWHAWLHHLSDAPLPPAARPFAKPHRANQTGTAERYRPGLKAYQAPAAAKPAGLYEAWSPDQG
ncbi:NADH-ubiquinone oxidoreductase subunit NDUFA12 family protein [Acidocella sp.]|uniref:NADH-ubiquinone oxidoreductase subunit NDUFA12 family protein n=1 Tax=Acidocella sp. TaxID=50710 RepID=UPI002633549D|nr:NADH-ubiquinone oxidoreductase subunit NDUFA12 family protein [Acidocella sp.]